MFGPTDADGYWTSTKDSRFAGAAWDVTVQDADEGGTTTSIETLIEAAEQIEAVVEDSAGPKEFGGDKGYQSNRVLMGLKAVGRGFLRCTERRFDRGLIRRSQCTSN